VVAIPNLSSCCFWNLALSITMPPCLPFVSTF
jgi:hypothetical protein